MGTIPQDRPVDPRRWDRTLFEALVDSSRRRGAATAVEDQQRTPLSYKRLVLASIVLGRELAAGTAVGERVGVFLPNVNAVAATLFGLFAYGRVPAMLNFTASVPDLLAACRSVETKTIVTSRRFVETAGLMDKLAALAAGHRILYLEDVRAGIGLLRRLAGALAARNPDKVHRRYRPQPTDIAIILFTSGTERQPKAVALTHANILANIEQVYASIGCTDADILLNPLPVFHAFGLTAGLFLPLIIGFSGILYPSPLHYDEIPKLARKTGATILIGIDTFAARWAKSAGPDDFRTMRLVVLGAERVKDATRQLWLDRCGIEILEGYGVTEAAPVVAVNRPGANRVGTVGPPLPGIETRLEPVEGIHAGQRLYVRGPNVMAGYYFPDQPGVLHPPRDGWHDSGDIVTIDEEGCITIVSRAKRFAKIAGEMISLTAVESVVAAAWPDYSHAVVAIADERKGEALVIVTDAPEMTAESIVAAARRLGVSVLTVPDRIIVVEALPLLGNGKTDYVTLERMAVELAPRARSKLVV